MEIISRLKKSDEFIERDGILYTSTKMAISYHEEGNKECFAVEENSFWFEQRNKIINQAIKKFSTGNKKNFFWDIGGGNGFVCKGLQDKGIPVILLEPGPEGCLNAQKRGVKQIICSTLQDANIKKNSMDSAGLFDVIEHIEDDTHFVQELYQFINSKGQLYLTVPAFQLFWSYHDVQAGHYRRYTINSLSKVLKKAGFEIEYATYFFSILAFPNFFLRTIPTLLGLRKNVDTLQKKKDEHINKKSFLNKILNPFWKLELYLLRKGFRIPFGNSILIVAKKNE